MVWNVEWVRERAKIILKIGFCVKALAHKGVDDYDDDDGDEAQGTRTISWE